MNISFFSPRSGAKASSTKGEESSSISKLGIGFIVLLMAGIFCLVIGASRRASSASTPGEADNLTPNVAGSMIGSSHVDAGNLQHDKKGSAFAAQISIARWIGERYAVAPVHLVPWVKAAFQIGNQFNVPPSLILAVVAVESSFDPNAESNKGAQGLMQVMTDVHGQRYRPFGGVQAAFDPIASMNVGTQILREYLDQTGSVERALMYYVGAVGVGKSGRVYASKVLQIQRELQHAEHSREMV